MLNSDSGHQVQFCKNSLKASATSNTDVCQHIRTNPITGQIDYFYPLEITDPSIRASAKAYGLEVCRTQLGSHIFDAVMVPCKETATIHGVEIFVDTPSEVQQSRYFKLIKEGLNRQKYTKQISKCPIPNGCGCVKNHPYCIFNPSYVSGGDKFKFLTVHCEDCICEQFCQACRNIRPYCMNLEDEGGEMDTYEIEAPKSSYAADRYLELREKFIVFVRERNPTLVPLAEMLTAEYTKSEAAKKLGQATNMVESHTDKLKDLVTEFLDNIITL